MFASMFFAFGASDGMTLKHPETSSVDSETANSLGAVRFVMMRLQFAFIRQEAADTYLRCHDEI